MTDSHLAGIAGISRLDFFCSVESNKGKELEIEIEGASLSKSRIGRNPHQSKSWRTIFRSRHAAGKILSILFIM